MTEHERESDLLRQRRANFDELVRLGLDPYPRKFERTDTIAELVSAHGKQDERGARSRRDSDKNGRPDPCDSELRKANFLVLSDGREKIQAYVRQDSLPRRTSPHSSCSTSVITSAPRGSCFARRRNELTIHARSSTSSSSASSRCRRSGTVSATSRSAIASATSI
jgi:lysyl-tRNA synthetase class 2